MSPHDASLSAELLTARPRAHSSLPPPTQSVRVAYAFGWIAWLALLASTQPAVRTLLSGIPRGATLKGITGCALLASLLYQLWLARVRSHGSLRGGSALTWHRVVGALGPVLLLAHATGPGYRYQTALFVLFLVNTAFGLAQRRIARWLGRAYPLWLVAHGVMSAALVPLAIFHAYIAAYYR
jgi:hypothetical protein